MFSGFVLTMLGFGGGGTGEAAGSSLAFPQLLIVSLCPRAASSHLPDFIRDDLSLALTIDGSGSPACFRDSQESSLFIGMPGRSQFLQSLGLLSWGPGVALLVGRSS